MTYTYRRFMWCRKKPLIVSAFLYICFCMSCVLIPESIAFSDSLCFAFVFSMIQMLAVALFMQGESLLSSGLMCVTLFFATVVPTLQMYLVMGGMYSKELADTYSCMYMLKELVLHLVLGYTGGGVLHVSKIQSIVVAMGWFLSETVLYMLSLPDVDSPGDFDKLFYIARMAPFFYMAFNTLILAS